MARHLCAWWQTKGNNFRLEVAVPSAPANLQLPMQATVEGLMLPLLTFYSGTLPHSAIICCTTNHLH